MSALRCRRLGLRMLLILSAASPSAASAQSRAAVEQERREFTVWLSTAPLSPRRAVLVWPIGPGLSLGPVSADIPLQGVEPTRLTDDGRVTLRLRDQSRSLARGRPVSVGNWRLLVNGPPGRAAVTVFGKEVRSGKAPAWYPYDAGAVYAVALSPSAALGAVRILGPDGVEVDASEAGTVEVTLGAVRQTLRVLRLPGATQDESELEIYFRDRTSGHGSYPAGRFVSLIPRAGGYLLDFNRARNPYCAYNSVFPCPAPWRGNALAVPIRAGERYPGGRLDTPAY
jgi:hypothetical protein